MNKLFHLLRNKRSPTSSEAVFPFPTHDGHDALHRLVSEYAQPDPDLTKDEVFEMARNNSITSQNLQKCLPFINSRDESDNGITLLSMLVRENNTRLITMFLNEGADPNLQDNDGNTSLHYSNDYYTTRMLLSKGANPSLHNSSGLLASDLTSSRKIRSLLRSSS